MKRLEELMKKHNLVIRVVPEKITSIYERYHKDKFPQGELVYLEKYKREMLVVVKTPKNAGKFMVSCYNGLSAHIEFDAEKVYNSIEEIIEEYEKKEVQ